MIPTYQSMSFLVLGGTISLTHTFVLPSMLIRKDTRDTQLLDIKTPFQYTQKYS